MRLRMGLVGGVLAVAGLASTAPARDLPEIEKTGTLRVLVVPLSSGASEFWSEDAARPGMEREMMDRFCAARKLTCQVVPLKSWTELVPALLDGRGDVIAGRFSITDRRRAQIEFTSPVFPTRVVLLTHKPAAPVNSLEELGERRVATVKGTSFEEALLAAGLPPARIDTSLPPGSLFSALNDGKVAVIAQGIEQAIPELSRDPSLQLGAFVGPVSGLAWGVRKGDTQLRDQLNVFLGAVRSSGEWNRLVVKYFGEQAPGLLKKARGE